MGLQNRSYNPSGGPAPSRFANAPVVKWLMIANAIIFLLDYGTNPQGPENSPFFNFGHLSINNLQQFQLWRLVTFQFLHGDIFHLLFNMFGLYMFGPIAERWWGSRRFAWFYGMCGIAGGLAYAAIYFGTGLFSHHSPLSSLVGASAGIFGIFVAVAIIAPNMKIQLIFPPIPMSMRTFAIGILAFGAFQILTSGNNAGGEAGHLGGALIGFLLMKFPHLVPNNRGTQKRIKKAKRTYNPKIRPKSKVSKTESSRVDQILDKINEQGFQSLTKEERELLSEFSKNDQNRS